MLEIGKVKDKRAPILRGKQTVAVLIAAATAIAGGTAAAGSS